MHKVLVAMDVLEHHKERLDNISPELDITYIQSENVKPEDVKDVEVIVGNVDPSLLKHCQNLKYIQLNNAGTEGFVIPGVMPEGATLTNATGAYGVVISEYMIGALLNLMKRLDLYKVNQMNCKWEYAGPMSQIFGTNTLIVGFGDIGSEFGIRMNAMGSKVTAIRRKVDEVPSYVESMHTMDDLNKCLSKADIVAACLPGYKDTCKVFDKEAFSNMKKGTFFVNVGRGTAVDTDALIWAINEGIIAGAALDVTDPEPLPSDHPLWKMPNILITPHVSGGYRTRAIHDRVAILMERNLRHFLNNEPLENIIDMTRGYKINH